VTSHQPELLDLDSLLHPEERVLGRHVVVRRADTRWVLSLYDQPVFAWDEGDEAMKRLAIAWLADQKVAPQEAIAEAFGVRRTTVWRVRGAWREKGVVGITPKKRGPKGPSVAKGRCRRQIVALGRKGFSRREIARRLGLAPQTVNVVFLQEGLGKDAKRAELFDGPSGTAPGSPAGSEAVAAAPTEPEEPSTSVAVSEAPPAEAQAPRPRAEEFPGPAAGGEPEVPAPTVGPGEGAPARDLDRALACAGLLDEAEPQFASGQEVPGAGALMALGLAASAKTSLFDVAERVYGRLRPAFYGLRSLLGVLFLMAMLRIKRTESLASRPPQALGRLVGLDRLPEVKTVRRKLDEIAGRTKATELVGAMADGWAAEMSSALGFLLVDGHVRVYSGTRPIPKGYAARRRIATRAITDYWVNEAEGQPLFVVTAPSNAHLSEVLPEVLAEARSHVGDRPITVVFDRGGWNQKLFRKLREAGYHLLTYRVGKFRPYPRARLTHQAGTIEGRQVDYTLFDTHIRLRGCGRMRCVAVERREGEQTHIVTTREDLTALEVAYRMFGRWRQENFFKYLREHFALDALVSYETRPDDPERQVPNPQWRTLSKRRGKVRAELKALERALGRLDAPPAASAGKAPCPSRDELIAKIANKRAQAVRLYGRLKALPRRVPLKELAAEGGAVLLEDERKRFTDVVKLAAYRVESELVALVAPHYRRQPDEGRALVREMMQATGDLEATNHTLTVRLRPLSARRHTAAMAAVCEELSRRELHFPGTNLVLHFAVKDASCCT